MSRNGIKLAHQRKMKNGSIEYVLNKLHVDLYKEQLSYVALKLHTGVDWFYLMLKHPSTFQMTAIQIINIGLPFFLPPLSWIMQLSLSDTILQQWISYNWFAEIISNIGHLGQSSCPIACENGFWTIIWVHWIERTQFTSLLAFGDTQDNNTFAMCRIQTLRYDKIWILQCFGVNA